MPDAFYSVDYAYPRAAQVQVFTVSEALEGEDNQVMNIYEREELTALNFGKIFFSSGNRLLLRARRKKQL